MVLWALINVVLGISDLHDHSQGQGGRRRATRDQHLRPDIVLAAFPLAAIWLFDASAGTGLIRGYFGLALANALMGAVVLATTLGMDIKQIAAEHSAPWTALRSRAVIVLALVCLVALLGVSMAQFGHQAMHAMTTA